jgi:flagellar protein FlgJ
MKIETSPKITVPNRETEALKTELKRLSAEKSQIGKLAEDFESVFLEMCLGAMRSTVAKSELVDGGQGEEIFRGMLDSEYAKSMASQRSSGIAKNIEEQMVKVIEDQQKAIEKRLGISEYRKEFKGTPIQTDVKKS